MQDTHQSSISYQGGKDYRGVNGNHRAAMDGRKTEPQHGPRAWATVYHAQIEAANQVRRLDPWYLDSVVMSHMTNCRDLFTSLKQVRDTVTVADGRQLLC
jgi:hypothetical protein